VIPWLATPSWLPLAILPPRWRFACLRRFFRSAGAGGEPAKVFVPDALSSGGVTVSYGRGTLASCAERRVTSFASGELTLVMGPSGSGKTTLLSLLGCLLTPDGRLGFVSGPQVKPPEERQRTRLRRTSDSSSRRFRLFHSLPALENVMIAARISPLSAAPQLRRARRYSWTAPPELLAAKRAPGEISAAIITSPAPAASENSRNPGSMNRCFSQPGRWRSSAAHSEPLTKTEPSSGVSKQPNREQQRCLPTAGRAHDQGSTRRKQTQ